jgi:hypothetical protein
MRFIITYIILSDPEEGGVSLLPHTVLEIGCVVNENFA